MNVAVFEVDLGTVTTEVSPSASAFEVTIPGVAGAPGPQGPAGVAGGAVVLEDEGVGVANTGTWNFVGAGVTVTTGVKNTFTIPGVAYGLSTQVPHMNGTNDGFIYDSEFTYDGVGVKLTNTNGYIQVAPGTNPAASGQIRWGGDQDYFLRARKSGGSTDIPLITWQYLIDHLTIGATGTTGSAHVGQLNLYGTGGVVIGCNDGASSLQQFSPGEIGRTATTRMSENTPRIDWNTASMEVGFTDGNGGHTCHLGVHANGNAASAALLIKGGDTPNAGVVSVAGNVTIRAGDSANGDGGNLDLRPGAGTGTDGTLSLKSANGTNRLRVNSTGLGLYTATPVAQQTVTGSRGGNAALADLLTKLAATGIIIDGTSA